MTSMNMVYKKNEEGLEDKKGFIEILINEQYSEMKRGITDHAKQSHGRYVRLREMPKQGTGEQSDDEAEPNLSPESNAAAIRKKNPLVFNESFVRIQSKEKLENGVEKVVERVGSRVITEQEWGELLEGRAAILALRERAQMEQQGDDNFHEESVGRELSEEQWQEWQHSQAMIAELRRLCGPTEEPHCRIGKI